MTHSKKPKTIKVTTADGLSLFKKSIKWKKPKKNDWSKYTPEELAEKIHNSIKVDHGRNWLLWMGVEYDVVKKYTDSELMAISDEVSTSKLKEPETCDECGQTLPDSL